MGKPDDSLSRMRSIRVLVGVLLAFIATTAACSSNSGSEAQQRGVGAGCASNADCTQPGLTCLPFKGGYCGLQGCTKNADCPAGSACVTHTDGKNYCFLTCTDKTSCNTFRSADVEANCSSTATFVEPSTMGKACVPPS
jgi:hypothetical protein